MPDVFVSYSRRDADFVRRLEGALAARGKDVWVDWEDIPPTAEWLAEVFGGIEASDNFLFVITPDSLTSEVCARELAHAVELRKRLVPVLHRDADGRAVPEPLAARNWTFIREDDDFDAALAVLVGALDTDLEWVSAHTRLLGRAREWERRGGDASLLLRGRDLEDAERWAAAQSAEREPRPTPLQLEYVLASRRETTRRQRLLVGAALAAVVVASTLAALAWWQRNEAVEQRSAAERNERLALSRLRAAEARAAVEDDPQRALALALRAVATAPTNQAVDALRGALQETLPTSVIRVGETRVWHAELSADGGRVVTASEDGRAQLWAARTGRLLASIDTGAELSSARLTPDGRFLLTAPRGGETGARLWRASAGATAPLSTFGRGVLAAALSPDGRLVATAGEGGVQVWSRATGGRTAARFRLPRGAASVEVVAFSRDGRRLVAAGPELAAVWGARTGRRLAVVEPPAGIEIEDAGLSPDGARLVTADDDGVARLWKVTAPERSPVQLAGHTGILQRAVFSSDGRLLLTAGNDATARVWDVGRRQVVAQLRGHRGSVVTASFASDDRRLVTAGVDGTARIWPSPDLPLLRLRRESRATVRDVRFSADGRLLVTAGDDGFARVWRVASASVLSRLRHGRGGVPGDWVDSAAFDRTGRHVVTAGEDGTVKVWPTTTGPPLATLGRPGGSEIRSAEFSPDAALVAAGGADGRVRLWRWAGGGVRTLVGPAERVDGVAFDPGGRRVAGASWDGRVWLWRTTGASRRGTPLGGDPVSGERFTSVAFSPSGERVAAGSSLGFVVVWDARTRQRLARLRGDAFVTAVDFSRDGRLVVAADDAGVARVVTAARGQRVAELRTRASSLEAATFSPRPRTWHVALAGAGGETAVVECPACPPLEGLVCRALPRVPPALRAEALAAFPGCRRDD